MTEQLEGQMSLSDLGIWCGKTFPEPLAATAEKTSKQSSPKSSGSQTQKPPMCLCLTRESGTNQDACTMRWEDGALLGDYTMHSFGESPREENASRLSQILQDCPPQKYSLSAKACQGILNRAERRGKQLPEALRIALEQQCHSKNEPESQMNVSEDVTSTLRSEEHGHQPIVAIEGNGMRESHHGDGFRESEIMYTLNGTEQHAVFNGMEQSQYDVVGVDLYNQTTTGRTSKTLNSIRSDSDHVPVIICEPSEDTESPG